MCNFHYSTGWPTTPPHIFFSHCRLQVKAEAATHAQALEHFLELIAGAQTAANQFKATKRATSQAKLQEQKFQEKEQKRLEKVKAKEEARASKKAAAEKSKAEKKAQKEREKQQREAGEAEEDGGEGDENQNRTQTRRGKGISELGETDPLILREKLPDFECKICVGPVEEFLCYIGEGLPTIWRLKRAHLKKAMECHAAVNGDEPCKKEINAILGSIKVEFDGWVTDFAEKCDVTWRCLGPGPGCVFFYVKFDLDAKLN